MKKIITKINELEIWSSLYALFITFFILLIISVVFSAAYILATDETQEISQANMPDECKEPNFAKVNAEVCMAHQPLCLKESLPGGYQLSKVTMVSSVYHF